MEFGKGLPVPLWALILTICYIQQKASCTDSVSGRVTIIPPLTTTPVKKSFNPTHNGQVCSAWGNFHIKTFDGEVYRFPGLCNYVFSSHCNTAFEDFNIQIRRMVEGTNVVISSIVMRLVGVDFQMEPETILVNGERVQLPYSGSGFLIEKSSGFVIVSDKMGLTLKWNQKDSVMLELDKKYANQTCGLCGDFNGIPTYNEFFSNNAHITALQFGNMQKLNGPTEDCEDPTPSSLDNCTDQYDVCHHVLTGPEFSQCNHLVGVNDYIEACVQDLCLCDSLQLPSCLCDTFAEYSRQCAHAGGQPQNWRTPDLCPMTCPSNMQYQECGSPCTDTCTNSERSQLCEDHCVDGCFCPSGTVYDDINESGCIPHEQCSCFYNGKSYAPGTTYSDDCLSCSCTGGQWNCTNLPCPGICSVEGGSHISTYDKKTYNVHGDCTYVLSKVCDEDTFTVLGELRKCGLTDTETCLKMVALNINGDQTSIVVRPDGGVFVNWIYTQLPFSAANVTVFRPSTFFTIIQTNSGLQLQIQLVPTMQLFVHLDPSFRGKTCGLCGNFNSRQTDDFKAISGVVEGTASAFANTWKTQAACPNIKQNFEDPCTLSIENEKYAHHWCGLLADTEGPFAKCHASVNPTSYQKNCIFDTCNCERSEDCMCAALSSYVRACADKGIELLGWRANVCTKYTTQCPKSLIYKYNVNTCQPTCRSLNEPDVTCNIKFASVDGCTCDSDTYMDDSGKCVPANKCPCYYKGTLIRSGEVLHDLGVVCTCTQGKLNCIGDGDTKLVCAAPMVYFDCRNATAGTTGAECQKSCQTLDMHCYSTQCVSGCMCPAGLVSDGKGGCIAMEECPCIHNDATYKPGEKIKVDCNTCVCKDRMWKCSTERCLGTCAVYGDGHIITFDDKRYNFNGKCQYTLVQDYCGQNSSTQGTFRVITENVPCGTTGTTCSKSIKVFLEGYELILSDNHHEVVQRGDGGQIPYRIRYMGIFLVIEITNGLILLWDKKTSIFIKLSPNFKGQVCGLCGNYDDNGINEFTTRSQSIVGDVMEFGNSWKVSPTCPDAKCTKDPCSKNPYRKAWSQKQCSIINSKIFAACHSQVEPTKYYEACVTDACACDTGGDCECFCTAVAAYAQACSEFGVCISWRSPSVCPMFCDYYNAEGECDWHYKPCGAPCMKTCRNPSGRCLYQLPGLEGCYPYCPANKPFFNEDEMKCVDVCGCYEPPDTYYPVGTTFYSRESCKTCQCTSRGKECHYDAEACYCYYEGKSYIYKDVIYNTTDGLGWCIRATCDVNGTIVRELYKCTAVTTAPPFTFTTSTGTEYTTLPETTTCVHRECEWTDWYDVTYPTFGEHNGDYETPENIRAEGYNLCKIPDKVECRAKLYPNEKIDSLNQKIQCTINNGLICNNKDQTPPICYNYEIKFLCCTYTPCGTSTPTVGHSTALPTTHSPSTAPASSAASTQPPVVHTTTQSTTVVSTKPGVTTGKSTATTHPTPLSTVIVTPTGVVSTPPVTQGPTSTSKAPPPQSTTGVLPTTTGCQPKCEWTSWFDVHRPTSSPDDGDRETYQNIRGAGGQFCDNPQDIECRAEDYPDVSLSLLGQKLQCNTDVGLICKNADQTGKFKMCYNYQVRFKCCDYKHCQPTTPPPTATTARTSTALPTTHSPSTAPATSAASTQPPVVHTTTQSTTVVSTKPGVTTGKSTATTHPTPLSTVIVTPTGVVSTPPVTQGPTSTSKAPPPQSTTGVLPTTTGCQPKCEWTSWFDVHRPTSSPDDGDRETYQNIRGAGGQFCDNPQDIECRAEDYPDVSLSLLGQKLQCNTDVGLICKNADQTGKFKMCYNYQVRFKCCDYKHCQPTTPPPTATTARTSTALPTTHSPSTAPASSAASTQPPVLHTTTQSTTVVSTKPGVTTGKSTATTHPTPLSTVIVTPTGVVSTPPVTQGPTSTSKAPPPQSTTGVLPTTTGCQPKCEWTSWFDVHRPTSTPDDGDRETYQNIRGAGGQFCDNPQDIECRAEDYPDVSLSLLGQKLQCNTDVGLICKNADQTGKFKMCYNYQVRFKCCDYKHCQPTTPPPTATTARTSTALPTTHSPSTAPASSAASTQPPVVHTTTQSTTVVSTKPGVTTGKSTATTHPTPLSTVIVTPTGVVSTPPVTQGPTSTSKAPPPQSTTGLLPTTTGCQPKCEWTSWFDVHRPTSSPDDGDMETYQNIRGAGGQFCDNPQDIECRAEDYPDVSLSLLGQKLQCNTDVGLICNNADQTGKFKMCYNYQVRFKCCDYKHCQPTTPPPTATTARTSTALPTTHSPSTAPASSAASTQPPVVHTTTQSTTVVSTKPGVTTGKSTATTHPTPLSTVIVTPTGVVSTPPVTQGPTSTSKAPPPQSTTGVLPTTTGCQPKCEWTSWFDVHRPTSSPDDGDRETYQNIRGAGGQFCDNPQDIECRAEDYPDVSLSLLGQKLQCNTDVGLICKNADQTGKFKMCYNYQVRFKCCDYKHCQPTTPPPTATTARTSTALPTTHSPSTAPASSAASTQPPVVHTTTQSTTVVSTKPGVTTGKSTATTHPTPLSTVIVTPTGVVSTPPVTQGPTSTSKAPPPQSTTGVLPTTTGCQPKCEWTSWFDVHRPTSSPDDGDRETYQNIRGAGGQFCDNPQDIECRAEDYPDVSLSLLGQKLQCNTDVGLICKNADQTGKFKMCYNYQVRFKCCDYKHCQPTTPPPTATTARTSTALPTTHSPSTAPASSAASTQPPVLHTTTQSTTVVSTKPGVTTGKSTATTHPTPLSTVIVTPTGVVSTPPVTQGPTSTSKAPPPQSTTGVLPTTTGCQPKCEWTSWFDVHRPTSSPDDGDRETYQNIRGAGGQFCDNPQDIECRAEDYPDVSLSLLGQKLQCNTDVGLICNNADQTGKFKMCYNYQVRFKCCDYKHCQPTTPPPTATTARTSTALPTTHSPSTAPASSAASTQPPVVHTTTQSTTVVSTKPGVTTGKSTATTHPTPLSTVIVTPTGVVSTPPVTQGPTSTSKAPPPQSTTGVLPTTTGCQPKCEWTSWFDVHRPTSSPDDGDRETYQNIRGAGGQFCDNPQDIECRAEDYPDVSLSLLGQKLQCNTDVGLICNNADQTGKFKMCYNYQVRFKCCDYKHCQPTTPPPTATTARTSTALPTTHSPSTAPASSAASTQPPVRHTTTQSTTVVSTKPGVTTGKSTATTHPTPLSTVIVTPTGVVSTPPVTQGPTSTSKAPPPQSTTGVLPTTTGCQPKCEWTSWFDVHRPTSSPDDGDRETYQNIRGAGGQFCDNPQDIECRAEDYPDVSLSLLGQKLQCNTDVGLICKNADQTGKFKMCYNYQVRFKCCDYKHCQPTTPPPTATTARTSTALPTTHSPSTAPASSAASTQPPVVHTTTQSTTVVSTKPGVTTGKSTATTHPTPLSTVIVTPTGVVSTPPVTQGPTSTSKAPPPQSTTGVLPTTTGCQPKCEWTSWFDVHRPTSSPDDGDRETYQNIRGAGGQFCDNPQDIECRAEDYPDVSLSLLGQKLQCNTDVGLICNNADQTGKFKMCYNYQVRFKCCDYKHCQPTTPPPTATTARTSTALPTTHSPSTAPASSAASTQPPVVHTTTQSTTVVSTKPGVTTGKSTATTHPTPLSTVIVTPTGVVSTPPVTQGPTSTSKAPPPQSTTGVLPTTTGCQPKCEWTSWFDVHRPTSSPDDGDRETYQNIRGAGGQFCDNPQDIECRAEDYPDVSLSLLGQKLQCNTDVGLICNNADQTGKFKMCYNYQVRFKCCDYKHCQPTTPPPTATTARTSTALPTTHSPSTAPASSAASTQPPVVHTTTQSTTVVSTKPGVTTGKSTATTHPTPLSTVIVTPTGVVSTPPVTQGPTSTSKAPPPQSTTGVLPTTTGCQPKCEWTSWFDVHRPTSSPDDGDRETYQNIRGAGGQFCDNPQDIECRAEDYPDVSLSLLGQKLQCNTDVGLICNNADQTGKFKMCYNYQVRFKCCDYKHCQPTTPPPTATTARTSTALPTTHSPSTAPASSAASTQPPVVHTTTQSTTVVSTKPGVTTGKSTATTHPTPLSTVIVTPTGVVSTPPVTQGPTSTSKAPPPQSTTGVLPTTTGCQPKCEWTSWFDVHRPTSSPDDGDRETYQNIRGAGGQFCDNPQDIECRAEDYPDVSLSLLGQKLQCNTDVGLICNNADQTGKFKMCYNYQVRFQCCDYKHCQPTTPPPTTTTARTSTTLPTTHSPSTAPASSAASTQPPIVHTTTQSTTVVSTKPGVTTGKSTATTHPTPLSTVIVTPTGGVSTPPLTQRPTSTSKVTSLQSTAGTRPTIMISTEGSTTTGKISTTTTSALSPATGPVTETVPPSTPTRSTQPPIVHTTTQSTTKLSTKPEVSTGISTATTHKTPLSTVIITPTGVISTTPVTQGPTSTLTATPPHTTTRSQATSTISTKVTTVCRPKCEWTSWFDVHHPTSSSDDGDRETYQNIRGAGGQFCDNPQDIECRAEDYPDVRWSLLGQKLQCNTDVGLICNNADQTGKFKMCYNYQVRFQCCDYKHCQPTTPPPTTTTARTSTTLPTTHSPSTAPASSAASTQPPIVHTTTQSTTVVSTKPGVTTGKSTATTHPTPLSTVIVTPTGGVSTPPLTQRPTSTSKVTSLQSTAGTRPTIMISTEGSTTTGKISTTTTSALSPATGPVTETVPPSTPTRSTQPPIVHTTTQSTTKLSTKPEVSTGISTATTHKTPLSTVIITPTGVISTTPVTQGPTSTLTATPPHTTTRSQATSTISTKVTTVCRPKCEWTSWFDVHHPTSSSDDGDRETYQNIRGAGGQFCDNPQDIECRAEDYPDVRWSLLGQKLQCNTDVGLICNNADQTGKFKMCYNYQVRFQCCDYKHCQPTTPPPTTTTARTSTTLPTTHSPSTAPASSAASTQPPIVHTTTQSTTVVSTKPGVTTGKSTATTHPTPLSTVIVTPTGGVSTPPLTQRPTSTSKVTSLQSTAGTRPTIMISTEGSTTTGKISTTTTSASSPATGPVTETVPPSTPTRSTQPPIVHTTTQSTTKLSTKPEVSTGISTATTHKTPLSTVIITPTGVISTTPVTQGPTSTLTATPPHTTTGSQATSTISTKGTTVCRPKCEWTSWFDVHHPTSSSDDGDRETYQSIRGAGGQFCDNPQDIECRAEDYPDVSLSLLGQKLQCNTDVGLICNNADQTGKFKMCYNYQVRFQCCDYKHCQPTTPPPTTTTARTSTTLPTTHSPSTAPASSAASTQPPIVHTTTQSTTVVSTKPGVTTGKSTATTHPTPLSTVIVTPTGGVSTPPLTQRPTSTSKVTSLQSTAGTRPTIMISTEGSTTTGKISTTTTSASSPPTGPVTETVPPSTPTRSTQPPIVHTTTQSTTKLSTKPEVSTGISTATTHKTPLSTVIITPTGVISTTPVTQGPTSTLTATPPHTTTGSQATSTISTKGTTVCRPKCEWTSWFDVHHPTSSSDDGDRETYQSIRGAGGQFCDNPQDIECRAEDYPDVSLSLLGQKLQCNTDVGLICNNADQTGKFKMCYNYQVRFQCCDYKHCQPTTPPPTTTTARTSTTLPTTHSPSTAPASSAASTQPPIVHTTTQSTTVVSTKPGVTTGKSTATTHPTPLSTVIVTPTGGVSTPPLTQRPTSTSKVTSLQSTAGTRPTIMISTEGSTTTGKISTTTTSASSPPTGPVTETVPPSTPTRSTQPPIVHTTTQSTTKLSTKPEVSTGIFTATTHKTPLSTVIITPTGVISTTPVTQGPTSTLTATPPHTTTGSQATSTISTKGTTVCRPKCEWTSWFDVHHPTSSSDDGDRETYQNIRGAGGQFCDNPQDIECRAEDYPDVSLSLLGQKLQCNTDVGLICNNADQTGKFKMCYNYQVRFQCCDYKHCQPPTATTARTSTTLPTTHSPSTAPASSAASTQPPIVHTTTQSTTVVSTKPGVTTGKSTATTHPTPLSTVIVTPTGGVSTPPLTQRPTSTSKVTSLQSTAGTRPTIMISTEGSTTTGKISTTTTSALSPATGPVTETVPPSTPTRSTQPPIVHTTTQSTTKLSTKPEVSTGISTATTHKTPLSTVIITPTGVISTTPVTQGPTSTLTATPPHTTTGSQATSTISTKGTTVCRPKCEWTSWFDVHHPTSSSDDGDRETYQNIRGAGGQFCDNPQDIECRAEDYPDVRWSLLGQKLQCNTDVGLICNNADQTGKFKMCYNYQVRFQCCDYKHCQPTTPPPTTTTARTSTTLPTTHSPSTAPASSAASTQPPIVHTTTQSTTVVSTKPGVTTGKSTATTHPTPLSTVIVTPTGGVSTPPLTQRPTSTSKVTSLQSTAGTRPTIMISTEGSTTTGKISTTTTSASSPPSTGPVTETVPPSTPTRSTQPPIVHTTTQSTTKLSTKPEVSTGKSTATTRPTPLSTVIVTPTGGVSTPPVTQGPTSTSKATSLQSTAGTRPTIMISTEGSTTISKFSTTTSSLPSTGPITKSFPPPTSAFTIASSAATTSTEGTTPVTLSTTTPCFCHVSGVNGGLYSPGEVIYNRTDSSGCSFYAVCNKNCEVERFQGCLSTTPSLPPTPSVTTSGTSPVPPTPTPTVLVPSTLLQTTSGVFTQPIKVTTGPVTPPSGCPAAEPPRKVNETWMLDNCTLATCEGNNRITLVLPPPVDNITCASGLQPQKILHEDGCTYHYECKCICSGWDYSKFVTFDGTQYIFDDSCTYILVKEIVNEQGNFSVLIDNGFCGAANNRSCTRSIIINYNSMEIVLNSQMHDGVRTNKVIFNNEVVNGGFTKDGITVTRAGIVMSVEIRALDAFISFDGHTFSIQLPFSLFQHNTEGQCGTCSNDRSDDCRLPSGHDANSCTEMASYWKVYDKNKPYCELTTPTPSVIPSPTPSPTPCSTPSPLCELIKSNIFADCHTVLPPEVFYHNCLSESCQTANDTQTCYQIEMYASLCTAQGFCSDWRGRTQGKCPYHCPEDKVYDACGPIHPATCEDKGQTSSMPEHVAEGCFCPTDKILFNSYTGICVPKSKACPCVGPDGLPKDIGTTWRSNCQECVCDELSVSVQCKPVACPTSEAAICEKEGFEPVSVLTSEDPCCPKIDCRCNISTCSNKSMTCEPGYDLVLNLHEGDCCPTPQCVPSPDVCVVNGTVYRPDMPVPSGPCETCTCGSEKDPATNQYRVECKPITCANCSMGYKRQAKEGDCCGECVPFACVIKLNDTTELLKPGEIWSLDANNCSQYECEEEDGAFILVSLRRTCPIIDPEECNPEEMELTPDGCCKRCKPPTPSKDCNIKKNQTLIRQNECISSELIELTYCEGACPSTSVYSNEAKAMQHKCTCCRELESHRRQVALTCQDGRSINYDYIYVDKCQCLDACIPGTTTLV